MPAKCTKGQFKDEVQSFMAECHAMVVDCSVSNAIYGSRLDYHTYHYVCLLQGLAKQTVGLHKPRACGKHSALNFCTLGDAGAGGPGVR